MASISDLVLVTLSARGFEDNAGLNPFLWGNPGMGKTSLAKHVVRQMGLTPIVIELSQQSPEDIGGLPVLSKDENFCDKVPMRALVQASKPDHVLIFDDFTTAPAAVQLACLQLILSREFGHDPVTKKPYSLSSTPIIAMGNHDANSMVSPLPPSVANRFIHINVPRDSDALAYTISNGRSQLTLPAGNAKQLRQDDVWNNVYQQQHTIVNQYVKSKGAAALAEDNELPDAVKDPVDNAYATLRSYELAARAAASAEFWGVDDNQLIRGCIGKAQAGQFFTYRKGMKFPSPSDIYAGKVVWATIDPASAMLSLSTVAMACDNATEIEKVWEECKKCVKQKAKGGNPPYNLVAPAYQILRDRLLGVYPERPLSVQNAARINKELTEACEQLGLVVTK